MTPELRRGLYAIDPLSLGADSLTDSCSNDRGGRTNSNPIMISSESIGQSAERAIELVGDDEEPIRKKFTKPRLIPLELQRLFTYMQVFCFLLHLMISNINSRFCLPLIIVIHFLTSACS